MDNEANSSVESNEQELYQKARRRVNELKGFYAHLSSYLIVNTGLIAVNLLTSPEYLWFLWVTLGWGIGLAAHAFSIFGMGGVFGEEWEQKKIREYVEKNRNK